MGRQVLTRSGRRRCGYRPRALACGYALVALPRGGPSEHPHAQRPLALRQRQRQRAFPFGAGRVGQSRTGLTHCHRATWRVAHPHKNSGLTDSRLCPKHALSMPIGLDTKTTKFVVFFEVNEIEGGPYKKRPRRKPQVTISPRLYLNTTKNKAKSQACNQASAPVPYPVSMVLPASTVARCRSG